MEYASEVWIHLAQDITSFEFLGLVKKKAEVWLP